MCLLVRHEEIMMMNHDDTTQQVKTLMYLHLEKEIHKLRKCTCLLVGNLLKIKEKQRHLMSLFQDQTKILLTVFHAFLQLVLGEFVFKLIFFS